MKENTDESFVNPKYQNQDVCIVFDSPMVEDVAILDDKCQMMVVQSSNYSRTKTWNNLFYCCQYLSCYLLCICSFLLLISKMGYFKGDCNAAMIPSEKSTKFDLLHLINKMNLDNDNDSKTLEGIKSIIKSELFADMLDNWSFSTSMPEDANRIMDLSKIRIKRSSYHSVSMCSPQNDFSTCCKEFLLILASNNAFYEIIERIMKNNNLSTNQCSEIIMYLMNHFVETQKTSTPEMDDFSTSILNFTTEPITSIAASVNQPRRAQKSSEQIEQITEFSETISSTTPLSLSTNKEFLNHFVNQKFDTKTEKVLSHRHEDESDSTTDSLLNITTASNDDLKNITFKNQPMQEINQTLFFNETHFSNKSNDEPQLNKSKSSEETQITQMKINHNNQHETTTPIFSNEMIINSLTTSDRALLTTYISVENQFDTNIEKTGNIGEGKSVIEDDDNMEGSSIDTLTQTSQTENPLIKTNITPDFEIKNQISTHMMDIIKKNVTDIQQSKSSSKDNKETKNEPFDEILKSNEIHDYTLPASTLPSESERSLFIVDVATTKTPDINENTELLKTAVLSNTNDHLSSPKVNNPEDKNKDISEPIMSESIKVISLTPQNQHNSSLSANVLSNMNDHSSSPKVNSPEDKNKEIQGPVTSESVKVTSQTLQSQHDSSLSGNVKKMNKDNAVQNILYTGNTIYIMNYFTDPNGLPLPYIEKPPQDNIVNENKHLKYNRPWEVTNDNIPISQPQLNMHIEAKTHIAPAQTDDEIISYYSSVLSLKNKTYGISSIHTTEGKSHKCRPEFKACISDEICISEEKWCDAKTDCKDGSDEAMCSCISRIDKSRVCDGYYDCPHGEEELGCFNCDPTSFSCNEWSPQQRTSSCFSLEQRCNGIRDCINNIDEQECTMIHQTLDHHLPMSISHLKGFLHKNYLGKWYPVCGDPLDWAIDACALEVTNAIPLIDFVLKPHSFTGRFIQRLPDGRDHFVNDCPDRAVHVTCPEPICGTISNSIDQSLIMKDESQELYERIKRTYAFNVNPIMNIENDTDLNGFPYYLYKDISNLHHSPAFYNTSLKSDSVNRRVRRDVLFPNHGDYNPNYNEIHAKHHFHPDPDCILCHQEYQEYPYSISSSIPYSDNDFYRNDQVQMQYYPETYPDNQYAQDQNMNLEDVNFDTGENYNGYQNYLKPSQYVNQNEYQDFHASPIESDSRVYNSPSAPRDSDFHDNESIDAPFIAESEVVEENKMRFDLSNESTVTDQNIELSTIPTKTENMDLLLNKTSVESDDEVNSSVESDELEDQATTKTEIAHKSPLSERIMKARNKLWKNSFLNTKRDKRKGRVVGGKRVSAPAAWPWMVALYRNGIFHCGGVLITKSWILSAAHCLEKYWMHYYEVQVGMLRRFSFSPQEQVLPIDRVVVNELYNNVILLHDIALVHLAHPAALNRWVRPVCLPNSSSMSPSPGTPCTTVGWGATEEHGPDPDHMREVEVPILSSCVKQEDKFESEVCAGPPAGGKDSCQGDSGGPLLCKHPDDHMRWYVVAIVSHGEGCARRGLPGVYARVAPHLKWIAETLRSHKFSHYNPKQKCPGFSCEVGIRRCLPKSKYCDGTVDCLGGEDEYNCQELSMQRSSSHKNNKNESIETLETYINNTTKTISPKDNSQWSTSSSAKLFPMNNVVENNHHVSVTEKAENKSEPNVDNTSKESVTQSHLFDSINESQTPFASKSPSVNGLILHHISEANNLQNQTLGKSRTSGTNFQSQTSSSPKLNTIDNIMNNRHFGGVQNISNTVESDNSTSQDKIVNESNVSNKTNLQQDPMTTELIQSNRLNNNNFSDAQNISNESTKTGKNLLEVSTNEFNISQHIPSLPGVNKTIPSLNINSASNAQTISNDSTETIDINNENKLNESNTLDNNQKLLQDDLVQNFSSPKPVVNKINESMVQNISQVQRGDIKLQHISRHLNLGHNNVSATNEEGNDNSETDLHDSPNSEINMTKAIIKPIPNLSDVDATLITVVEENTEMPLKTTSSQNVQNSFTGTKKPHFRNLPAPVFELESESSTPIFDTAHTEVPFNDLVNKPLVIGPILPTNRTLPLKPNNNHPNNESIIEETQAELDLPVHNGFTNSHINKKDLNIIHDDNAISSSEEIQMLSKIFPDDVIPSKRIENPRFPREFLCKRINQTIPTFKKCNRQLDCEDGSDEWACLCPDFLLSNTPELICDGFVDCPNREDEENCFSCPENYFHCPISKTCVPIDKVCNKKFECVFGEDELDCYALYTGDKILLDMDLRPHLFNEGVFAHRDNGIWQPVCKDNWTELQKKTTAKSICNYLGFSDYERYETLNLHNNADLNQAEKLNPRLTPQQNPFLRSASDIFMPLPANEECHALYVKCLTDVNANLQSHNIIPNIPPKKIIDNDNTLYKEAQDIFLWPWVGKIYVEGKYTCSGVLVDLSWVLVENNCGNELNLVEQYVSVVFGSRKATPDVDGPYEEIVRIDYIEKVSNSFIQLLHIERPTYISRYIKPLSVPIHNNNNITNDGICLLTNIQEHGVPLSIFLKPMQDDHCGAMYRCFQPQNYSKNFDPTEFLSYDKAKWSSIIVCYTEQGWYPAALFNDLRGLSQWMSLPDLTYQRSNIREILDRKIIDVVNETYCLGVRCHIGNCVPPENNCDGVLNCRDGRDETEEVCTEKQQFCSSQLSHKFCGCASSQLKCENKKCLPKTVFANGIDDCGDGSDEPREPDCFSYMILTYPGKICDGIIHCLDRSDEDPKFCNCHNKVSTYKCPSTGDCIAHDTICDGVKNCLNGEDEMECSGIKSKIRRGAGEVIERKYGAWQSKCFEQREYTRSELEKICRQLKYSGGHARLLSDLEIFEEPAVQVELDQFTDVTFKNAVIGLRKCGIMKK